MTTLVGSVRHSAQSAQQANQLAYPLALQLLQRESDKFSQPPAIGHTEARAIRRFLLRLAALAEVAASVHVGERTLRRQPAYAGASYRVLLDDSRMARAPDLMSDGPRSVAQVAQQTGFADTRSLPRAFKLRTGHAPSLIQDPFAAAGPDAVTPGD